MRESDFRNYLGKRIGSRSVDSYIAYCNRLRRELNVQLDSCDLSVVGISNIGRELGSAGVPAASIRNCLSALRAYAEFRGDGNTVTREPSTMRISSDQREAWAKKTADGPFNRWLDAQVRRQDGAFVLDRLYEVAEKFGIKKRSEYRHLNPGQQRMSLGNLLRRVVPKALYETETDQLGPIDIQDSRSA